MRHRNAESGIIRDGCDLECAAFPVRLQGRMQAAAIRDFVPDFAQKQAITGRWFLLVRRYAAGDTDK